jgi:hypothetical protein
MNPEYVRDLVHRYTEPFNCYVRKNRVRTFGSTAALPVAEFKISYQCVNSGCTANEADIKKYLTKFKNVESWANSTSLWRPTASVMDLGAFGAFSDYELAVSRQSRGNDNRMVKKANRKGYQTRNLGVELDMHEASLQDIHRSKLFRTGGLVLDLFTAAKSHLSDRFKVPTAPFCNQHWAVMWGVFTPQNGGEHLIAYATIARTGNFVRTLHVMGHADFLRDGVMKLLFFDIVRWLMDPQDPNVQGIQYFLYGAIEHGRPGMFEWKRRLQFKPFLLQTRDKNI